MSKLVNPWISNITRSYQQIKEAILSKFPSLLPEITDLSEANPFVRFVSVWAGIVEMISYYLDNQSREAYPQTATLYDSIVKHANSRDYRIRSSVPATVDLTFSLNQPHVATIYIPIGTRVTNDQGVVFATIALGTFAIGETSLTLPARQIEVLDSQDFEYDGLPINLGTDIADGETTVVIGADTYTLVDTFAYSNLTDRHFTTSVLENGSTIVIFGDEINGQRPNNADIISIVASITLGVAGNLPRYSINILDSAVTLPVDITMSIYNLNNSSNGLDVESLNSIAKRIIINYTTRDAAVTDANYASIAELVNGVTAAQQDYKCLGKIVPVYIATTGGAPSSTLLKTVKLFFKTRKMVTTDVDIFAAGIAEIVVELNVAVLSEYVNSTVKQELTDMLVEEFSPENQKIGGSVRSGNIYQLVELWPGVDYSKVLLINVKPTAIKLLESMPKLIWERATLSNSTAVVSWKIQMISTTKFKLLRDNAFLGNFDVDVEIAIQGLRFTVTSASYVTNDAWTFKTYPYNDDVTLEEMSLPVIYSENVTINATGGI